MCVKYVIISRKNRVEILGEGLTEILSARLARARVGPQDKHVLHITGPHLS